jgi:hypothetical protein
MDRRFTRGTQNGVIPCMLFQKTNSWSRSRSLKQASAQPSATHSTQRAHTARNIDEGLLVDPANTLEITDIEASGRDLTRYYSSLADSLGAAIFPFAALDIWQHVADKDREYFRASREKRVGKTLEALVADRHARVPAFRGSLAPLLSRSS